MSAVCDVLLKNGRVVDGTGTASFLGDVAMTGDTIVAVGSDLSKTHNAGRVMDCTGMLITPGWVDIHTHYDGQITWDPLCSPSTSHGVTTVMFGNCGIGKNHLFLFLLLLCLPSTNTATAA